MNADPKPQDERSDSGAPDSRDYLVSHGKNGILGVYSAAEPLSLKRGQSVIVRSSRGVEIGMVLSEANVRHSHWLGAGSPGQLIRKADAADQSRRSDLTAKERELFEAGRVFVSQAGLPLEVVDVDLLFDERQAFVQFVGEEAGCDRLAVALEEQFRLTVRLENVAGPGAAIENADGGCGKPECGRSAGGCTSCGTGGGCSSCGSHAGDLRPYFSHLREKMASRQRISLA